MAFILLLRIMTQLSLRSYEDRRVWSWSLGSSIFMETVGAKLPWPHQLLLHVGTEPVEVMGECDVSWTPPSGGVIYPVWYRAASGSLREAGKDIWVVLLNSFTWPWISGKRWMAPFKKIKSFSTTFKVHKIYAQVYLVTYHDNYQLARFFWSDEISIFKNTSIWMWIITRAGTIGVSHNSILSRDLGADWFVLLFFG